MRFLSLAEVLRALWLRYGQLCVHRGIVAKLHRVRSCVPLPAECATVCREREAKGISMTETVIELKDVTCTFMISAGALRAKRPLHSVNGVSLTIKRGEVVYEEHFSLADIVAVKNQHAGRAVRPARCDAPPRSGNPRRPFPAARHR